MSCVLTARGNDFSVDEYLKASEFRPDNICRRGEARPPSSDRRGEPYEFSSFSIIIGESDLDNLPGQIDDATEFLERKKRELEKLRRCPGVEEILLNFSVRNEKVCAQHYQFPPDILSLAGGLGAGIIISHYAVERPPEID